MGIFSFLRRTKKTENADQRRSRLLTKGRVTDGIIIDIENMEEGDTIAHYSYIVHGVEFESSDLLTEEQKNDELKYAPGASVSIRFDPINHGNAVLV